MSIKSHSISILTVTLSFNLPLYSMQYASNTALCKTSRLTLSHFLILLLDFTLTFHDISHIVMLLFLGEHSGG